MGFLDIKGSSIYFNVEQQPKLFRPLMLKPESMWVYMIPSVKEPRNNKLETIRRFRSVDARFSNWMKDNPDPLWDKLDTESQYNRKGERVDFPVRPQFILAVYSYQDNDVKIIKQGSQIYEEMEAWADSGGNVMDCDWLAWNVGESRTKEYKTQRQDASHFVPPGIDPSTLGPKVQAAMEQAFKDLLPWNNEEDMLKHIHGQTDAEAQSFPFGANATPQLPAPGGAQQPTGVPGYTPGGQSPVNHGAIPGQSAPQPHAHANPPQPQFQAPQPNFTPPQPTAPAPQLMPQPTAPAPQPAPQPVAQSAQPAPTPVPAPNPGYTPAPTPATGYYNPQQETAPVPQPTPTPAPPQETVPNAPVSSPPVFAPPQQAAPVPQPTPTPAPVPQQSVAPQENPADITLDFGKYNGKTLGWILQNDAKYLDFLKGKKKHLAGHIAQLLGTVTAQNPQAPQQPAPQSPAQPGNGDVRAALVKECNAKLMQMFQGSDIVDKMMPFLQETIGHTDFSEAPLDQLQTLKAAIDGRLGA
jgi:hypothetical protein